MNKFYLFLACTLMCQLFITKTMAQYPGSGQKPLDPESIPQYIDFLPHFAGLRVNAKDGKPLIVEAVMTQQVAVSTGTKLEDGEAGRGAGVGNYFVYRISKDGGKHWTLPLWPSFTIEALRGVPVTLRLKNKLNGLTYKDVNIAADQTVMMDGVPLCPASIKEPYDGPIPIALHLHGGEVPSTSDGGPHAWFTPDYAMKGKGWDMGVSEILRYPNTQEATTLWYHEHSQLGLTRINVYAGMAGFYFLRDDKEDVLKLPGWSGDDLVQEVTPDLTKTADVLHPNAYLPEIELAIQDRMFDTKGQLYYDVTDVPNKDVHPFWNPESFGDVITVNGKTWPYLSVAPRKYRFHILDGSNARFYRMWLEDDNGEKGPAFIQIGTDGGMLSSPVTIDPAQEQKLLMGPGERCDIIIDFSNMAPGTRLTLRNDANTPYPVGDEVEEGTTDRIMQFIVNGQMVDNKVAAKKGRDKSHVPSALRLKPLVQLTDFAGNINVVPDVTRQLTLNEVLSETGPLMVLLNNSRYESMTDPMSDMKMFGETTEKPIEGNTEVWQLINTTMDAHPMHMHLVQFQLVSRQDFDMKGYMGEYMESFGCSEGEMEGMSMAAQGPPLPYDKVNCDGAIGGNPGVNKYLSGSPVPPEPNERGWKDVIIAYPNQVTTYIVRFAPTDKPLNSRKASLQFGFDPSVGPGYVWHCHIVEHEDNDMMRPMEVMPNPVRLDKSGHIIAENNLYNDGFSLAQNMPNPFTKYTEISFMLPKEGTVQLVLYDSQGRAVKTLMNGSIPAGNHKVVLEAENLDRGIYFYRLTSGSQTETKKLIIN